MRPLEQVIASFKVGEPIKSLFNPKFALKQADLSWKTVRIKLTIQAPDALGIASEPVEVGIVNEYFNGEFQCEEAVFIKLRQMLHQMVTHEVDEAISVGGRHIFDPHRARPRYRK